MSMVGVKVLFGRFLPGWAVFFSTLIALLVGSWSPSFSIGGDPAVYLYEVYRTLQGDALVWRGYFSSNPMGHPAPILHLVLAAGAVLAQLAGFEFILGSAVAYLLMLAACVGLSTQMMYRGSRDNPAVAVVFFASVLWLATRVPSTEAHSVRTALTFFPIYGPSFSAVLALPALSAAYAVCNGRRQYAWVAVLFGALTVQASSSGAPLGALSVAVGLWAMVSGRLCSKHPLRVASAVFLGFGPFVVRLYTDGWLFPYEYAKATVESRNLRASLYPPESFYVRLNQILGSTGRPALILVAMFSLAAVGLLVRRSRPGGIFLLLALVLQSFASLWFATVGHQAIHLSAVLPTVAASAATLLYTPAGLAGSLRRFMSILVAASIVGFSGLSLVFQSHLVGGNKAALSYEEMQGDWVRGLISSMPAGSSEGLIGLIAEKDPYLEVALGWVYAAELYLELSRSGIDFCTQPNTSMDFNGTPPSCAGRTPDRWLVFDSSMRSGRQYLQVLEENPNVSLPAVFIHLSDSLAEVGYVYCEGGSRYWMFEQNRLRDGCV